MALLYVDLYKLAQDVPFQQRVQFALWRAANAVLKEAASVPDHVPRVAWARTALLGPSQQLTSILNRVLTAGAVANNGAAVDDAQLQNVVDSLITDIATA